MFLHEFFARLSHSAVGAWVNDSVPVFASVLAMHVAGLSLTLGIVLAGNVSVIWPGFAGHGPANERAPLAGLLSPFLLGLAITGLSGALLVSNAPDSYYFNALFAPKFQLLAVAVLAQLALAGIARSQTTMARAASRGLAVVASVAWIGVAILGRWLGFI